jgi:sugar/nucleoside kinase (ribokinase family)
MLDCGGRAEKFSKEFLEHLHFISPNETELERIVHQEIDENTPEEKLVAIVQEKALIHYPNLVVILKLGANGSLLISKEYTVRVFSATHYSKCFSANFR